MQATRLTAVRYGKREVPRPTRELMTALARLTAFGMTTSWYFDRWTDLSEKKHRELHTAVCCSSGTVSTVVDSSLNTIFSIGGATRVVIAVMKMTRA
jgi:hypothetical protein